MITKTCSFFYFLFCFLACDNSVQSDVGFTIEILLDLISALTASVENLLYHISLNLKVYQKSVLIEVIIANL